MNDPFTITIPATEKNSGGASVYAIPANLHTVIDDDVNEVDQNFVLVAQVGDDVPDTFVCFQHRFGSSGCSGREGAIEITIVDNDRKQNIIYMLFLVILSYFFSHDHRIFSEGTDHI